MKGVRYFIRFQVRAVPAFGDASEKREVLLTASDDAQARVEFEDFCCQHPTEFNGMVITSEKRLIKERVLAKG